MRLATPAREGLYLPTSIKRRRARVEMIGEKVGLRRVTVSPNGGVRRVKWTVMTLCAALEARTEYLLAHLQHLTCPQAEEKKHREFEFPFRHAFGLSRLAGKYAAKPFIWLRKRLIKS
jgi:hypothetical protein